MDPSHFVHFAAKSLIRIIFDDLSLINFLAHLYYELTLASVFIIA